MPLNILNQLNQPFILDQAAVCSNLYDDGQEPRLLPGRLTDIYMKTDTKISKKPKKAKEVSLTEAAATDIRNRILDLTLAPGERVDEKLLMERFGLSRTPTREAVNRLATEGLIDMRLNRGAYVHPLDLDHISNLFDAYVVGERMVGFFCNFSDPTLRSDLEAIQAKYVRHQTARKYLKITQQNARFHSRLAKASGNEYIIEFCARLYNLARRVSFFIYLREGDRDSKFIMHGKLINEHHNQIIQMVKKGDRPGLIDALTNHAALFRSRVIRVLDQSKSSEFPLDNGT